MAETRTLAIDIGGSGIKAAILDEAGRMITDRHRVPTPAAPLSRDDLLRAIDEAVAPLGGFDRVSVGFPGYIRDGRIVTAPNLGSETLGGFDLQGELAAHWERPVRVLNDADVQGFGAIRGHGIEMVVTLGTGFGTAIFRDGEVMPHLELAHHPVRGKKTYEDYVGNPARHKKGNKTWNKRVAKAIDILREVVRFDHLYIGGGNAKHISFLLPEDVSVVPNTEGLTGGIGLWRQPVTPLQAASRPPAGKAAGAKRGAPASASKGAGEGAGDGATIGGGTPDKPPRDTRPH